MSKKWTTVIEPKHRLLDLQLKEVWKYRDLTYLLVKKNLQVQYKQTILGPLWHIISPLLTTLMHTILFGNIAKLSTEGAPQFLFYLAGNSIWLFFAACLTNTSNTFVGNANIFGKVYFPRLCVPISTVITAGVNLMVQYIMFLIVFTIYFLSRTVMIPSLVALPITLIAFLLSAIMGLGFGIIISSLTTKYRDLAVLVSFGVQLWMYATPVVYSITTLSEKWQHIIMVINPMASVITAFRNAYLGIGDIPWSYLGISSVITLCVLFGGVVLFNKVEKNFMDTV